MSEEAEIVFLREKINEVNNDKRLTSIVDFVGMASIVIGLVFWSITLVIVGVIAVVFGFISGLHYNSKKNELMEQLRNIGLKAGCPKCEKQISSGNFKFCPFCGTEL